jgi:transcriptional regulator with GAF, ATPase, and Fis domain
LAQILEIAMNEMLIKVAPTIYDILEATIKAAIEFTEADAGHIFLVKRVEDHLLVSHQCLRTEKGRMIRQYQEDRPFIYGPCQRSIDEGKMYYVHDAKTNSLHQVLLTELGRLLQRSQRDSLKRQYLQEYIEFLAKARSYVSVPIKSLNGESIGALGLYSYASEDYFGAMKKRIIEEYMDNFASALIISLIDKASRENQRMKELLESYREQFSADMGSAQGSVFDVHEHGEFRGVGPALEHLLRKTEDKQSWHDIVDEIERFFIDFALRRTNGRVSMALKLLKMPKRTFYNKVKKLAIDVQGYSRPKHGP